MFCTAGLFMSSSHWEIFSGSNELRKGDPVRSRGAAVGACRLLSSFLSSLICFCKERTSGDMFFRVLRILATFSLLFRTGSRFRMSETVYVAGRGWGLGIRTVNGKRAPPAKDARQKRREHVAPSSLFCTQLSQSQPTITNKTKSTKTKAKLSPLKIPLNAFPPLDSTALSV